MRDVLAVALASMRHDMSRVDRIALNLANVATPAYKREVVAVRPFAEALEAAGGAPEGSAEAAAPAGGDAVQVLTDLRPGTLKVTGQPLDLALTGEGYFEIATPAGLAYTRLGSFHLDGQGRLVTAQGDPVLGRTGEIRLSTASPAIDADGNVTEPGAPGGPGGAGGPVAQLKVVLMEAPQRAQRLGEGLFSAGGAVVEAGEGRAQLRQGALENGNVNSMQEMVALIETMRHFESMNRIAQGYDEMMGSAIRKLGEL
jgi:flagellar basal-body rod protein FlgG